MVGGEDHLLARESSVQRGAARYAVLASSRSLPINISLSGGHYVAIMNTFRLLLPILLGCYAGTACTQSTDSTRSPVIEIEPMVLVDTIHLDSTNGDRHYIYQLRNTGNAPLIIRSVRSSDPCFCGRWPYEPVLPGATVELEVHCGQMYPGHKQQAFTIESNAAEPVVFRLKRYGIP